MNSRHVGLQEYARRLIRRSFTYAKDVSLLKAKEEQLVRFRALASSFQDVYAKFDANDCSPYILDTWQGFVTQFVELCRPSMPEDFLQASIVLDTLTSNPIKPTWRPMLAKLKELAPDAVLKELLEEDLIGNPRICEPAYLTSPGRIMHVFTLLKYDAFLKSKSDTATPISTIVEFGGGFGGLARIWTKFAKAPITYIILDTPIMCAIQWQYLSSILGPEAVNPVTSIDQPILENRINLLPVSMLTRGDIRGDLFVSTWALSESNSKAQQAVVTENWFGARHLLMAFQRSTDSFPYAEKLHGMVEQRGGLVEELPSPFVSNYYAFA